MLKQELEKKLYELQNKHNQLLEDHKALQFKYDALDMVYGEYRQQYGEIQNLITEMFKMVINIPAVKDELMRVIEENIDQTNIIETAVDKAVEWIDDTPYRRAMES